MKKLILILLFTSISFAQGKFEILGMLMSGSDYKNKETTVYLASLTTPISPTYAATLDSFITKVKDSLSITSLSSKFDVMYDLGGYSQEQSLKNLVKRSSDATAVNSPTWTQWQGFGGDTNTVRYVNTNYNPNNDKITYAQTSNAFGVYVRTDANGAYADIGVNDATPQSYIYPRLTDLFYFTNLSAINQTVANTDSRGFFITSRTASNLTSGYKNGDTLATSSINSAATPVNVNFHILRRNATGASYSIHQVAFAFIGAGLSATEVSKLTNCVEWLQDRKGVGVIP